LGGYVEEWYEVDPADQDCPAVKVHHQLVSVRIGFRLAVKDHENGIHYVHAYGEDF
jgi:hypothetical protein